VDRVIVSVHGGVEDSPWPSPFSREAYRSLIDSGATLVHGHHSHVPQGYEAYGDGVIFYGLGNFAVDPDKWQGYPNGMWSLAAVVDVASTPVQWRALTLEIRQEPGSGAIRVEESRPEEGVQRRRYLELCTRPLGEPDLFAALWQEVALRGYLHYGAKYMGFAEEPALGRRQQVRRGAQMVRRAIVNPVASASRPKRADYLLWHVMLACESHREMLATALGVLGGEIEDARTEESRRLADEMMPWSRDLAEA